VTHARSGDKGANVNVGFFPRLTNLSPATASDVSDFWAWLRTYLSLARMQQLLGDDWQVERYKLERCEFEGLKAVHFVVYGLLGRGVSSATNLDVLGKGVADWIRARVVDVPERFLREGWGGIRDGLELEGAGGGGGEVDAMEGFGGAGGGVQALNIRQAEDGGRNSDHAEGRVGWIP